MKKALFFIATFLSLNSFSQKITEKIDDSKLQQYKNQIITDTAFKVIYAHKSERVDSLT
jgi:hypothetical protein